MTRKAWPLGPMDDPSVVGPWLLWSLHIAHLRSYLLISLYNQIIYNFRSAIIHHAISERAFHASITKTNDYPWSIGCFSAISSED